MLRNGRGAIVNIASMSGSIVNRGLLQAHYNASKAAVVHLTKSLAMEWAARGVRVNAHQPRLHGHADEHAGPRSPSRSSSSRPTRRWAGWPRPTRWSARRSSCSATPRASAPASTCWSTAASPAGDRRGSASPVAGDAAVVPVRRVSHRDADRAPHACRRPVPDDARHVGHERRSRRRSRRRCPSCIIGWSFLEGVGAALILPAIVALVAANFGAGGAPAGLRPGDGGRRGGGRRRPGHRRAVHDVPELALRVRRRGPDRAGDPRARAPDGGRARRASARRSTSSASCSRRAASASRSSASCARACGAGCRPSRTRRSCSASPRRCG